MVILTSVPVEEIRSRGSIKDSDVLKLRNAFRDAQAVAREDADQLIALDGACPVKDPAWSPFLVEAITDYIVCQAKPEGYMVADKTDWLIDAMRANGQLASYVGYDLLLSVLDRARWSPTKLVVFAMEQIKAGIVAGNGPHRIANTLEAGAISQAEIERLTELLIAFGGASSLPVTRAEAEVLIEINRALLPGKGSPAWTELFVKAVGNAALAGLGLSVPDRATALGHHAWLPTDASPVDRAPSAEVIPLRDRGFAGRMIAGGAGSIWSTCRALSAEERALRRLECQRREIITNERLAEADEGWLLQRLGSAAALDDNEVALLTFIQREAATLPKAVSALIARATIAA